MIDNCIENRVIISSTYWRIYVNDERSSGEVAVTICLEKISMKQTRKRRILIVDDSEMNREILTGILENEYDIVEAEDGKKP